MNTRNQNQKVRTITASNAKRRGGRVSGSKVIDGKVVRPADVVVGSKPNGNGHAVAAVAAPVAAAAVPARSSHLEVESDAGKVKVQLDNNFVFVRRDYLDGLESRIAKIKELAAA